MMSEETVQSSPPKKLYLSLLRDNHLNLDELRDLYAHLKENPSTHFFYTFALETHRRKKWASHPALRERIIFIMEAAAEFC